VLLLLLLVLWQGELSKVHVCRERKALAVA
jgi:hypothetical protein